MMYKLFFLVCLCACVFGEDYIESTFPSCAYHLKITQSDYDGDYYGMIIDSEVVITKNISADGSYDLIRCDIRNDDGECYATFYRPNDQDNPCQHDWVNWYAALQHLPFSRSSIAYDDTKYPKSVKCVNGTDGCQKYCRIDDEERCVIVDASGFFVQQDGVNFELCDSFDMNIFKEDDKCNDPQYSAPHNLCETVKTIKPVIPECSYHIKVDGVYSTSSTEYYGVHLTPWVPIYLKRIDEDGYFLVRRDVSVGNSFYSKLVDGDQCSERPGQYTSPSWYSSFEYDSASYPQDVKCPNGSNGCKLYCLYSTAYDCITLDAAGRFVKGSYAVWTYYDDEVQMSVFENETCAKEPLPAPTDFCKTRKLFTPKYGDDCTFHFTFHESDDRRRDEDHYEVYGMIANGNIVAIKVVSGEYITIARFDVVNDEGEIYIKGSEPGHPCADSYQPVKVDDLEEVMPVPSWYDGSKYPVPTECPDGSDGCNKYCSVPDRCIIVDTAGRVVQDHYGNWTYHSQAPSVDVFAVDTCKGEHIPAPTACNGGQSSTPEPPKPSTSAPTSSASIVKSAFTFVVILIVVALL